LVAAGYRGNREVVQLLVESGADVNAQFVLGRYSSALAAARNWGHDEVTRLLIELGADVNAPLQVRDYDAWWWEAVAERNKRPPRPIII
jgi:ankyrin repeat protein